MKKAKDYLQNVNSFTTREELYNIGRQIQEDAIRETVKNCAENAEMRKICEGKQIEEIYPIYSYGETNIDEMGIRTKEDFIITGHGRRLKYEKEYNVINKQSILSVADKLIKEL